MNPECRIASFLDTENSNFMNDLIECPDGYFLRRLDQSQAKPDNLIAKDNGIPITEINLKSLYQILKEIKSPGTYSYKVPTIDGDITRIAISKEY